MLGLLSLNIQGYRLTGLFTFAQVNSSACKAANEC